MTGNMDFIQSFWIDTEVESPEKSTGGWLDPTFHYLSWILSCSLIHEKYGSVSLFCNSAGKSILVDSLRLPYKKIDLSIDSMDFPSSKIWVFKKLYIYSIQNAPFLHIDGDVFLFENLPDTILNNPISIQNFEKDFLSYREIDRWIRSTISLPCEFDGNQSCMAINVGIVGGTEVRRFSEFYRHLVKFYSSNCVDLDQLCSKSGDLNRYIEQLLLYNFLTNSGVNIKPVIANNIYNSAYIGFARLERYPHLKYAHLMSRFKLDRSLCHHLASIVYKRYPNKFFDLKELLGDDFDAALDEIKYKIPI